MPAIGTLHLISGLPCSGKSTYAEKLRDQREAVHLGLDRWLITCFGRYPVETVGHDEHVRRVYACREIIWEIASEFLRRGADVILDDGFILRRDREDHIARARSLGASTIIHFVDTRPETVRKRLAIRNRDPGEYRFEIDPQALDGYIAFFETPTEEEGGELVLVRDSAE